MSPVVAIYFIWGLWLIAWFVASVMGQHEPGTLSGCWSVLFNLVAAAAAVLLLTLVRPVPALDLRYALWTDGVPDGPGWVLVVAAFSGFILSVLASIHRVARLQRGARLIDSGPYAVVRHPRYLGVIAAAAVTAVLFGQVTSAIGAAILIATLIAKVLYEESAADDPAHRDYRARVPMFVPFWPMKSHPPRNTGGRLAK